MQRSNATAYRAFRERDRVDSEDRARAIDCPMSTVNMQRSNTSACRAFRDLADPAPLPRLAPYQRCTCGLCPKCRDNARWDRIFAKFEVKEREPRGMYRCALEDF